MDELIFDWNLESPSPKPPIVQLNDETLRDGLQSPSVRPPSIEQKLRNPWAFKNSKTCSPSKSSGASES